jgi:hypothetical protein
MIALFTDPKNFFIVRCNEPNDLFTPSVIVVLISGFAFADTQLISQNFYSGLDNDVANFLWRISIVMGGISSVGTILICPLLAGIIAASSIVLWGRDGSFVKLVEIVSLAQTPSLISQIILFILLLLYPVEAAPSELATSDPNIVRHYLQTSTILGTTFYISYMAEVWGAILTVFAIHAHFKLSILKSFITIATPYIMYRLILMLFSLWS